MVLTVLEAQVTPGREGALQAAYAAAAELPPGPVRSELLRDAREATRWRIQTWWVPVRLDENGRRGVERDEALLYDRPFSGPPATRFR